MFPLLGIFLTVAGCGKSGPARFDLHGEVKYKGKPLPAGVLIFDPDAKRGNDGPQGYALVKDGIHAEAASCLLTEEFHDSDLAQVCLTPTPAKGGPVMSTFAGLGLIP